MRWALSRGPGDGWCTYVLDYRRFPCFYSNKWHSLYSCGQLDSLTVDGNKYCMWLTLSCQLRAQERDGKFTWRQQQLHFLGFVTIVTSWWFSPSVSPHLSLSLSLPSTPSSLLSLSPLSLSLSLSDIMAISVQYLVQLLEGFVRFYSYLPISFVANCELLSDDDDDASHAWGWILPGIF